MRPMRVSRRVQVSAGMAPDRTALLFLTLFLTPPYSRSWAGAAAQLHYHTIKLPHYQTTTHPYCQVTGGMPQHAEPPVLLRTPIVLWTPVTVRVLRSERLLLDWAALLALVKPGSSPPEALPDYHVGEAKRTQVLSSVVE